MQENPVQQVPVDDVWGNTAHMPQKAGIDIPEKKGKDSSGKRKTPKKSDDKKRQNKNPRDKNPQDTKSSKSILPIILAVVLFAAGIVGIGFGVMSSKNREEKNLVKTEVTPEPTAADTPMPEPTTTPEPQATNTPTPEPQATNTP
ncbi:MAG: hypothetical protein Q4B26_14930, partial [Eubacteriales bacterium]|nr:hypothetical protein [Eubacteriales bacterium]